MKWVLSFFATLFSWRNFSTLALGLVTPILYASLFPPVELYGLAWVTLVPWLLCVQTFSLRRQLVISTIAGMVFYLIGVWWIAIVTIPGYICMVIFFGLLWPLAGLAIHNMTKIYRVPLFIAVAVVWTGMEHSRSWLVTGFPWFFLGHSQVKVLSIIQIADLVGAYGVTFVVAMVNGVFAGMAYHVYRRTWNGRKAVASLVVTLVVLLLTFVYGTWRLTQETTHKGPRIAAVQEDFPLTVFGRGAGLSDSINALISLSYQAADEKPDLIVWPETCIGVSINPEFRLAKPRDDRMRRIQKVSNDVHQTLAEHARIWNSQLIIGAISKVHNGQSEHPVLDKYNSAIVYSSEGRMIGRYDKMHLVLFGESVPFRYSIPKLYRFLNENMTPYGQGGFEYSLTPGKDAKRFDLSAGGRNYRYSVAICYEDVMPYLIRRFVDPVDGKKQIDFLVNISNDGWFDHSSELPQHLYICVFRAVENRIGIVRAVNTGISGFIDPRGRIEQLVGDGRYGPGIRGVAVQQITLDDRVTIYSRYGDWFAVVCSVLMAVSILRLEWLARRFQKKGVRN